jgi:hypothetical protein
VVFTGSWYKILYYFGWRVILPRPPDISLKNKFDYSMSRLKGFPFQWGRYVSLDLIEVNRDKIRRARTRNKNKW